MPARVQRGICLGGVCTPVPPQGGSVGTCGSAGDGGAVQVVGTVSTFPDDEAMDGDGGTVTFFNGTQTLPSVPIELVSGLPGYSITVPVGTWTARVQMPGVLLPTYFPGIEIRSPAEGSTSEFPLWAAVDPANLPFVASATPQPGHIVWVVRGATCDAQSFLGGYTVGLSPAPPDVSCLARSGGLIDVVPGTASSPTLGEFLAEDAPYATTQYTLALDDGAGTTLLVSGTFVPPPYVAGQNIAVALMYPNFTQ